MLDRFCLCFERPPSQHSIGTINDGNLEVVCIIFIAYLIRFFKFLMFNFIVFS